MSFALPRTLGSHRRPAQPDLYLKLESLDGLIDDAGGLAYDADFVEWRVELGVLDVLVGDPYRCKDGLVEEASLDWRGSEVEVVDAGAEDG
jgi:hypothetical protein